MRSIISSYSDSDRILSDKLRLNGLIKDKKRFKEKKSKSRSNLQNSYQSLKRNSRNFLGLRKRKRKNRETLKWNRKDTFKR